MSGFAHAVAWEAFPTVTFFGLAVVWYTTTFGVPLAASMALGYWHPGAQGTSHLGYPIIGLSSALGVTLSGLLVLSDIDRAEILALFLILPVSTLSAGMLGRWLRNTERRRLIATRQVWRPLGQFALAFVPLVVGVFAEVREWQDDRTVRSELASRSDGGAQSVTGPLGSTQATPPVLESVLLVVRDSGEGQLEERYLRSPSFLNAMEQLRLERLIDYPGSNHAVAALTERGARRMGMLLATDVLPNEAFAGRTSGRSVWFRLDVQGAGNFIIDVTSDGDGILELYDASGDTLLAQNDDRGGEEADSFDPLIERRLPVGTYFIRVGDFFDENQEFEGVVRRETTESSRSPILFKHGLEDLQARRDGKLHELGPGIHEEIDERQVALAA